MKKKIIKHCNVTHFSHLFTSTRGKKKRRGSSEWVCGVHAFAKNTQHTMNAAMLTLLPVLPQHFLFVRCSISSLCPLAAHFFFLLPCPQITRWTDIFTRKMLYMKKKRERMNSSVHCKCASSRKFKSYFTSYKIAHVNIDTYDFDSPVRAKRRPLNKLWSLHIYKNCIVPMASM